MSTKFQAKPKQINPKKQNQEENEIIEIKEAPISKQVKASQKNKENTENSSSEATTPNKKRQYKKKKDTELIEIMDIEIPDGEFSFGKKKSSAPPPKQNKTPNKEIENEKPKKKGKLSIKSVTKIASKDKSPLNRRKKEGKVASITLEESDKECEIEEIKESKDGCSKRKNTSKTPHKKITHKESDKSQDNRNKKVEKKKKKNEKEEEIIQCELLSEESQNKDFKEKFKKKRKNKKNLKNSGYLTSRKMSLNSLKSMDENENTKSKSTIKTSKRDEAMKEKMNNFLGRKRKADNKNQKSKTPNQKNNKNKNLKEKASEKNKEGKVKSKTPDQKEQKKNDKNTKLNIPKMEIDDQNSKEITPELAILNQIANEYGLGKVIDTICKPKLNQKNKLDLCIQGLKDSCAKEKLPFLLIKMLYSYFDSKYDDNRNITKRSTSAKKTNIMKNLKEKLKLENSAKSSDNGQKSKSDTPKMENTERGNSILKADEEIQEIQEEKYKENKSQEKSKSNNKNSPFKEEKYKEKRIMSIGSHYNKTNGEIFKYQVSNLDGKGNAIFKCYDEKCNGMGIYELDSKKFSIIKKHNLKHAEHDYIRNLDKDSDSVFKNLAINDKCDAQVFKENGERTVNIY